MKRFALICLRLFYAARTERFCVWNQSFGSSSKKRYTNRMSTHFRSGPAFGLSAEVKSKVSHRSDVVSRFCQALKLTYLKINQNHIRAVCTRFFVCYTLWQKKHFCYFSERFLSRVKSTLQTKRQQQKKPTPILSKRGNLCRVGIVKHFNSDDDCLGMCIPIALI